MSDDFDYKIEPQKVHLIPVPEADRIPLDEQERKPYKITKLERYQEPGCWLYIFICIILIIITIYLRKWIIGNFNHPDWFYGWSWAVIPIIVVGVYLIYDAAYKRRLKIYQRRARVDLEEREREKTKQEILRIEEQNRSAIIQAEYYAKSLTDKVKNTYTRSISRMSELTKHLDYASGWLRQAQFEYNSNAFAPYWDAVQNAAINIASYQDIVQELSKNADEYYRTLNGKQHTFPEFPVTVGSIPDATPVVDEFHRVLRLGQTHYQFADIWEQRMTRQVLIAGFRTLGEAVNNLGRTVENSVASLQQSVSSDIARVVQENIKTRDALEQQLEELIHGK
jgi:hypothetical protein